MVLREIEKIMANFTVVENVVAFYDDGTVFQTTFDKSKVNIPKLGNDLASIINIFKNLQTKNDFKIYRKIIFDGLNVSVIVYKAGEQSNIAFFFKKELTDHEIQNINAQIKIHITRIDEMIDIDRKKLIEKELERIKLDLKNVENKILEKRKSIEELDSQNLEKEKKKKNKDDLEKELNNILQEKKKLEEELMKINSTGLKK